MEMLGGGAAARSSRSVPVVSRDSSPPSVNTHATHKKKQKKINTKKKHGKSSWKSHSTSGWNTLSFGGTWNGGGNILLEHGAFPSSGPLIGRFGSLEVNDDVMSARGHCHRSIFGPKKREWRHHFWRDFVLIRFQLDKQKRVSPRSVQLQGQDRVPATSLSDFFTFQLFFFVFFLSFFLHSKMDSEMESSNNEDEGKWRSEVFK